MQWILNMKIGAKLIVSFIIVALITGAVGVVGIMNLQKLQNSNKILYEKMTLPIAEVGQISTSYQRMRVIVRDMIIENSPELIQSNADKVIIRNGEIDEAAAAFQETIVDPEMQAIFDEFVEARKVLAQEFEKVKELAIQNRDAEAFALLADYNVHACQDTKSEIFR
ncbi:MCP four helix bundle domain-containing protein [Acetobacterium malicum]|uniref:MCP four helix bundle domain-containing protein n=1 Tax=Acetobacterium malicum TaxID=52692 RepID=UPI0035948BFB